LKSKFKEINDGTTGSSIPHTDKAKIYEFDYFITDENYLKNFNQLYWNFLSKILDNKKQIQTLSKTRDELLPKLMKGEVRVV
jgi:type I restriction enzyme S subunit